MFQAPSQFPHTFLSKGIDGAARRDGWLRRSTQAEQEQEQEQEQEHRYEGE